MASKRQGIGSPFYQGNEEKIVYELDFSDWNITGITGVSVKLYDAAGTDVSATKLSGSATVTDLVVKTPFVQALTAGERYRLECQFTNSGSTANILSGWIWIIGED